MRVEDTSVFLRDDMLDRRIKGQEAGTRSSVDGDEVDAKLVGAYAAYARGLTPRHAGAMLA